MDTTSQPHLFLAVDMLSDLSYSTLPLDIPRLSTPRLEEDRLTPVNFDDLLDIAREFEFTRTITHVWPCDEEPSTCPEPQLDDILSAIVYTSEVEECPLSMTVSSVRVEDVDPHRSAASVCLALDANTCISADPVPLPKVDHQVRTELGPQITSTLQGWSPPNGLQFLDLDDSLMFPQPANDTCSSSWLAMFVPTESESTQPLGNNHRAFHDAAPQTSITLPDPSGTSIKSTDDPRKKSVPQSLTRAILEPVRARSATQANSNVPTQTVITSSTKTSKSRPQLSAPATGNANYARAPRGGIPPHIARSVTKVNVLRAEKERKVMQDAFASTTTGEAKKPSVLRRTVRVEKETNKMAAAAGSGKKPSSWDENEENSEEKRVTKRMRT